MTSQRPLKPAAKNGKQSGNAPSAPPDISLQQNHKTQKPNRGRCHRHTGRLLCPIALKHRGRRCHGLRRRPRRSRNGSDRSGHGAVRRQRWRGPITRHLRHSRIRGTDHEARASRRGRRRRRYQRGMRRARSRRRSRLRRRIQRVVLADEGRDIQDDEARFRAQEASRGGPERRGDGRHPRRQRRRGGGHVGVEVVLVLGVDVGARDGGLRRLPAVEGVELRGVGAGRGGEEGGGVGDEFGVGGGLRRGAGGEEEEGGGGCEERRRCVHGGLVGDGREIGKIIGGNGRGEI